MGLGLAIVRRFADLLGHEIALDSREGIGSRFRVVVPRVTRSRPIARPMRTRSCDIMQNAAPSFADHVVAVVDDDAATLDAMQTLFETWGATVVVGDAIESLIAAIGELERYPDLVVADLRLADDCSGIDAVRQLRRELGMSVPAIIVSGDTGTGDEHEARDHPRVGEELLRAGRAAEAEHEARAAGLMLLPKPVVAGTLRATAIALMTQPAMRPVSDNKRHTSTGNRYLPRPDRRAIT